MVFGPFAETKGPRLPGRNPASLVQSNNSQLVKCGCTSCIFSLRTERKFIGMTIDTLVFTKTGTRLIGGHVAERTEKPTPQAKSETGYTLFFQEDVCLFLRDLNGLEGSVLLTERGILFNGLQEILWPMNRSIGKRDNHIHGRRIFGCGEGKRFLACFFRLEKRIL